MSSGPLARIREAVLSAADEGADPRMVSALCLRISAEVAATTESLSRDEWDSLAETFWDKAVEEHFLRVASKMPVN